MPALQRGWPARQARVASRPPPAALIDRAPCCPNCHSLLNLELLLKFGPGAWRMHNEALASFVARLQVGPEGPHHPLGPR